MMLSIPSPALTIPTFVSNSRYSRSLRFGDWHLVTDIGTSAGISARMQAYNDNWQPLGKTSVPIRLTTPSADNAPVRFSKANNKTALDRLVEAMADLLKQIFPLEKKEPAPSSGKSLVLFIPGQVQDNVVSQMGAEPEALYECDLDSLPSQLQKTLQATPHLQVSSSAKMIVLNDMAGGTAAAMAQLAQKYPDKFKPGLDATYMMTGGGIGIAEAFCEGNKHSSDAQVQIHLMELGALRNRRLESNGEDGSRMSPLLEDRLKEFAAALPKRYEALKSTLINSRDARIITDYSYACQFIPDLTQAEFLKAATKSTRDYLDMLGGYLRIRIATGSNLAILGGKTCAGYRDFVNAHSNQFHEELNEYDQHFKRPDNKQKTIFDKVFLVRVRRQLPEKLQGLFDMRKFDIVSDMNISSNTEGARYILQGEIQSRSDRVAIPAKAFLNSSFTAQLPKALINPVGPE